MKNKITREAGPSHVHCWAAGGRLRLAARSMVGRPCPCWSWQAGRQSSGRPHAPVPHCLCAPADAGGGRGEEGGVRGGEGAVADHSDPPRGASGPRALLGRKKKKKKLPPCSRPSRTRSLAASCSVSGCRLRSTSFAASLARVIRTWFLHCFFEALLCSHSLGVFVLPEVCSVDSLGDDFKKMLVFSALFVCRGYTLVRQSTELFPDFTPFLCEGGLADFFDGFSRTLFPRAPWLQQSPLCLFRLRSTRICFTWERTSMPVSAFGAIAQKWTHACVKTGACGLPSRQLLRSLPFLCACLCSSILA